MDPTTKQKNDRILDRFLVDFWSQHASQEGAPEIDFRRFFASWGHLGAKMAPRPPQTPPRGLLGSISGDFGPDLDDCWLIMDPNLDDFWSILDPNLVIFLLIDGLMND